ncbi:MAG TPA: aspartyl protease family protein [Verrucomicrobiae bacterium]|nr:aspartyl protease family protein [Verrucomicrobiae bacterium]
MLNRVLQWTMAVTFAGAWTLFSATATNSIVIPFKQERGHVMVGARLNGGQQVSLMVDTGYGLTMLHPDVVDQLGLRRRGHVTIVGIAGEEEAEMFEGAMLDFGGLTYAPRRVAALPSDRERSRRRDGVLGSGFFRRFVVVIDAKTSTITLHEPATFEYTGGGEVIPLTFRRDTPILEASLVLTNGQSVPGKFELDTGCDGALCLGSDFVAANHLTNIAGTRRSRRSGIGGGRGILPGAVPELRLGRLRVIKPSASFFLDGSPAESGMAGHIGWDALRLFRVIIDYERRRLVLEQP